MPDETSLRQEGPQQDLWQVIYDAAAEEGSLLHDDTVTAIERGVSAEIARLQARIDVLEGSIDYLRNVIDHPVTQALWLPINSAPKDGTNVLLGWPKMVLGGYWSDWGGRESWVTARGEYMGSCAPTHWMPLPVPPAEEEK